MLSARAVYIKLPQWTGSSGAIAVQCLAAVEPLRFNAWQQWSHCGSMPGSSGAIVVQCLAHTHDHHASPLISPSFPAGHRWWMPPCRCTPASALQPGHASRPLPSLTWPAWCVLPARVCAVPCGRCSSSRCRLQLRQCRPARAVPAAVPELCIDRSAVLIACTSV